MKNGLNLSYKKMISIPNNANLWEVKAKRQLFAIKFTYETEDDTLLINIDGTCINR